jgi:hypothetical protein
MKISDLVSCSWHNPKNAVVVSRTGSVVSQTAIESFPHSDAKTRLLESHGMCNPCMKDMLGEKRYAILTESIRTELVE